MDDLRVASAEVSGVELNSKSSPNNPQIRSSDIIPSPELIEQWCEQLFGCPDKPEIAAYELVRLGAQWGADQELDACCELIPGLKGYLREKRRPKPATLKEQSLKHLEVMERDGHYLPEILQDLRRAVEQLDG